MSLVELPCLYPRDSRLCEHKYPVPEPWVALGRHFSFPTHRGFGLQKNLRGSLIMLGKTQSNEPPCDLAAIRKMCLSSSQDRRHERMSGAEDIIVGGRPLQYE